MIPYVSLTDMQGPIPGPFLSEALDDGDSITPAQVWNSIACAVGKEIDGVLGSRYSVPFSNPIPAVISRAAFVLAAEMLYLRRGKTENPFTTQAVAVREQLRKIGDGEQLLAPVIQRPQPVAILEPAGSASSRNKISL